MSRHEKAKSGSFLDTWFRGPKKGTSVSRSTGLHIQRPTSESDMPDDEAETLIYQMADGELNKKFEEMLNDMNLTDEKKEPLRQLPIDKKKSMLVMHCKGSSQESKSRLDKPMDYINYLSQQDLSFHKTFNCVESLRIALTNNTLSWVNEFGANGLKLLLSQLNRCCRSSSEKHNQEKTIEKLQYECLRCLKAFMNNTEGLKQVLELTDEMIVVAQCLDHRRPIVMSEALRIMAVLCLVDDDKGRAIGHENVMRTITVVGEKRNQERFKPIIDGLSNKRTTNIWSSCLQFINAVITRAEDFEYRIHLRNEIIRAGLGDVLDDLKQCKIDEVDVQTNIFESSREEDADELAQRFDNVKIEMDDINDCFEVVKNTTLDSQAEPYFLSILQHLLFIRDDHLIRPAYYKLIEECVTQIVLHKSGLDPDFRANRRFQIDVQPLIDGLKEASKAEEEKKIEDLQKRLDEMLALKQEALAKLAVVESRLAQGGTAPQDSALSPQNKANIAKALGAPPPPPMPGMMGPPPPPLMPGMTGPPPPPMPGMMGPPPPPMPGMGGGPPPPPPPFPGGGGPPPPPPFGMGAPPPFPGMMMPRPDVLPHGLKPKKKWDVSGPLKRANWKTIVPQKMSEKSFWVKCQEDRMASPDILTGLAERFSSKPPSKKIDDVDNRSNNIGTMKKVKELKVLDGKAAQNISIFLGGSLKHMSYSKVKSCLLRCDDSVLNGNVLEQLIQYLPPPDQLNKLQQFKEKYTDLTEAEQFCVTLSEVKRLLPRLKSLSFRQRYAEMVSDVKPDIVSGTAACEEVRDSQKFAKVLELILLLGNYMNTGSKNGQAFGFEISFLTKLTGTKDLENKQTLLHYLVESIERKFPELLNFYDEMTHIDKASRVSLDNVQKILRQMDASIKNLETDLTNSKIPQHDEDKFAEVMGSFAVEAREQCTLLQGMFKHMESLYTEISEYFSFDKAKYNLEEFFTDLKTFKDSFIEAHKDNMKERETAEKSRRAKEAREKAEKERQERAARKKLVDMNPEQTQEGVMDSLLEALQTGSAFSREQKRRRGPRVAGAERRAQLARSRSRTGLVGTGLTGRELSSEILSSA